MCSTMEMNGLRGARLSGPLNDPTLSRLTYRIEYNMRYVFTCVLLHALLQSTFRVNSEGACVDELGKVDAEHVSWDFVFGRHCCWFLENGEEIQVMRRGSDVDGSFSVYAS
jgi:hypothetical protein